MREPGGLPRARILAVLGLTALAPVAGAATYYVAPNGSDAGPGSLAAPWRTIQKAANTVVAGDTVLVRSGTYAERVVLVASGTPGAEITFAAYPGEAPVIDGATVTMPDATHVVLDTNGYFDDGAAGPTGTTY